MLSAKQFLLGALGGTIYDFENALDTLPMHEHDETTNHMTVVARGSFTVKGLDWESQHLAGDVIDWQPNDPHEFIALEPNSRLVNIRKM